VQGSKDVDSGDGASGEFGRNVVGDAGKPEDLDIKCVAGRLHRLRNCAGPTCRLRPSLKLRLRSAGRPLRSGACPRRDLRLRLGGRDRERVTEAEAFVGHRRIATVEGPPITERLRPPRVRPGRRYRLRVQAELRDGRIYTLDRRLRACR